jgi:hypothetical protein
MDNVIDIATYSWLGMWGQNCPLIKNYFNFVEVSSDFFFKPITAITDRIIKAVIG